ncbi:MAG: hypothetical protein ACOX5H_09160 [Bacillus licheniformis]
MNEKANQLARRLKARGLMHGNAAAIMMERSLESSRQHAGGAESRRRVRTDRSRIS